MASGQSGMIVPSCTLGPCGWPTRVGASNPASRRALAPAAKVPQLLAGHVAARPTGENLLKALQEIALAIVEVAGERQRLVSELSPLHRTLLSFVGVPEVAYARLAPRAS
jgi:hypothetical protein